MADRIAALFDLDGTLIDSRPAVLAAYRFALAEVTGALDHLAALGTGEMMKLRMTEVMDLVARDRAAECVLRYDDFYRREGHAIVTVYPGVVDMLADLQERGVALGIVTNKGRNRTGRDLDPLDGRGTGRSMFTTVVTTEDTVERKPSPQPLLLGLERGGWRAAGSVYVGDGPHDAVAAAAAGMRFVGAAYGYYGADALAPVARGPVAATAAEVLGAVLAQLDGAG